MRYKHPIYSKYECDEEGNIYSYCNNKWGVLPEPKKLNLLVSKRGYYVVTIGHSKLMNAHKFIMECKLGRELKLGVRLGGMTINHINKNKLDNRMSNLELLECGDNTRHSVSKYKTPRYIHFNKNANKYVVCRKVNGKSKNYSKYLNTIEECQQVIKELGW